MSTEDRIVALEERLAHHERMADEISDVLTAQARQIDLLSQQVRRLRERLIDFEAGHERSPQDDKPPPHY